METPLNTLRVAGSPLFRARNTVPFALALAAAAAFAFLSGGYVIGRSTPIAVAFLCAAAVWVWFLRRSTRPPHVYLAALGVFAAFTGWAGLSVLWSFGPDLTLVSFNLTAFYLAVAAVLGLTSARGLQVWTVAFGFLCIAAAVGAYAFLGKGLPAVVTHAHIYARLDSPVGYWNVLALMMVMGICVALAIAGDRTTGPALRTVAAAAAVPMSYAFFFTFSRGGWIALGVALVLYFSFTTTRLASFFSLLAVAAPVAFVLWRLRGLETLFAATTDAALRTQQGGTLLRWAIMGLLVTAGLQVAIALVHRAVPWPRWSAIAAGTAVLAVVLIVAVGGPVRFVQARGGTPWIQDRWHELVTDSGKSTGTNQAGRLVTLTTNGRIPLWREAARQSRSVRATGTGAGTFAFTHYRFRVIGGVVKHAHSQWFNVLSELGVVGLALFVAAIALFVAAMIGNPFSHRRDPLHPLLVALQAGVLAFLVHMSWDWDWDMAAIGTLVFASVAVCASYRATRAGDERRAMRARRRDEAAAPASREGETSRRTGAEATTPASGAGEAAETAHAAVDAVEGGGGAAPGGSGSPEATKARRSRRAGWAPRVVASAALLLLAASWLPPYFALRAENAALAAGSDGDVTTALDHARRAAAWDPLAVTPLLAEARLLQQLGRNREALDRLQAAAKLQPQNFAVWYELGLLLHGVLGRDQAARAAFTRALALNPDDVASRFELELLSQ